MLPQSIRDFSIIFYIFIVFEIYFYFIHNSSENISLINFEQLKCEEMFKGNKKALNHGSIFTFNESIIIQKIRESIDKCSEFQNIFQFFTSPLSEEERQFPLAYGMLVHKNFVQISLLLSAIYQPQNQFCIGVDGKSSSEFIEMIQILSFCHPNIHFFIGDRIEWCGYGILKSVFECVDYLAKSDSDWQYFQYLSGVDGPLKSNLEMVRIFKALNGTFNAEIRDFEWYRLNGKRYLKSPLPLIKTSLSASFSRKSANFMIRNQLIQQQIKFLKGTICADESLWATIAGNPTKLQMPGGFDAHKYLRGQRDGRNAKKPREAKYNVTNYYISRYQQYSTRPPSKCKGYYYRESCVFGVNDLPTLISRHELFAHKLYVDFQPAAFFCLVENARKKSRNQLDSDFQGIEYQVQHLPNRPKYI